MCVAFSWKVFVADQDAPYMEACGISTDRQRAIQALGEALRAASPDVIGEVWCVEPHPTKNAAYDYSGLVASAQYDSATGCVVWPKGALR